MPGSTYSGNGSQASSGSRRAKTRSYHVVAHTSQVDESLFGEHHSQNKRKEMLEDKWRDGGGVAEVGIEREAAERSARRRSKGKKGNGDKRETVQVITKDLIRNLIVPEEDPSGQSIILSRAAYERIKYASRVPTEEEKRARVEELKDSKKSCRTKYMKERII